MIKEEKLNEEKAKSTELAALPIVEEKALVDVEEKTDIITIQDLSPVEEQLFLVDFLSEYRNALTKKHPRIGEYKFKWTQKAIIEAVKVIYKKYSIYNK